MRALLDQLLDHVRGAWRFRWIALGLAGAICVAGWAVVFAMPDRYGASARVYVDTRTALSEVTKGISVETSVETQIDRVRQQMLGAPVLQRVGDETDLFRGVTTPREKQQRIDALRKDLVIRGTGGSGVYIIEYENRDRDTSLRVVDKLLNTFVEGTLGGKRSGQQKAQEFLEVQIADYARSLTEAEGRVAEFKKKNFDVLPGAEGNYLTRLQEEMSAMQKAESELRTAMQERAALQRQLNGQQPYVSQEVMGGANAMALNASGTPQRIREAEARLDELLVRYKDKHPEVEGLRGTIADLKKRHEEEVAAAQRGDSGAAANAGLSSNPVYQQIQLDFNKNEVRIAALQSDLAARRRESARLRNLMDTSANVEAEFAQLNRDYEVTQETYQQLLQRMERTRLGEEAEATGVVQFEVIDPPSAPYDPVAPARAVLIALVLVAALGAGGAVAYLLHLLKPVFYTSRALAAATNLPVIGVVPRTWLDRHRRVFRHEIYRYAGGVAGLVFFAVIVISQQSRLTGLIRGLAP